MKNSNYYENIRYEWGTLVLQEKGSYVNKAPFRAGLSLAAFVGSISSFAIETFSSQMQNLGGCPVQCRVHFLADQKIDKMKQKYPADRCWGEITEIYSLRNSLRLHYSSMCK